MEDSQHSRKKSKVVRQKRMKRKHEEKRMKTTYFWCKEVLIPNVVKELSSNTIELIWRRKLQKIINTEWKTKKREYIRWHYCGTNWAVLEMENILLTKLCYTESLNPANLIVTYLNTKVKDTNEIRTWFFWTKRKTIIFEQTYIFVKKKIELNKNI